MAKKRAQPVKAAKKGDAPETPPTPQFYATVKYKEWLRAQLDDKEKHNMSLAKLAKAIVKLDASASATSGGLSLFLGSKKNPAGPSNTTLMPMINEVFKIAPPPVCDPSDEMSQLRDRLAARWSEMTEHEQKALTALLSP